MLDSVQKTLIGIASVSRQVVNKLVKHDGCKTPESFLLDRIVVGSRAALETLNMSLLKERMVDDRLVDWLRAKETKQCLNTLNEMDKLLEASSNKSKGASNFMRTLMPCQRQ